MSLAAWAERNGVARVAAYRWFRAGLLPVPPRRVGRSILVDEPIGGEAAPRACTAAYARVSSADQGVGLDRLVARVTAWATARPIPIDKVVTDVGSALNGHHRKFLALLSDPSVGRVVVEHRDRCRRFRFGMGAGRVGCAGPRVWWWSIRLRSMTTWCEDMTEILTSMYARLLGKRAAANRAKRAVEAAAVADGEAA